MRLIESRGPLRNTRVVVYPVDDETAEFYSEVLHNLRTVVHPSQQTIFGLLMRFVEICRVKKIIRPGNLRIDTPDSTMEVAQVLISHAL